MEKTRQRTLFLSHKKTKMGFIQLIPEVTEEGLEYLIYIGSEFSGKRLPAANLATQITRFIASNYKLVGVQDSTIPNILCFGFDDFRNLDFLDV